jgi:hypothetical protein
MMMILSAVIPGRRESGEPGIHTHRQWLWIPGSLAEPVIGPAEGRTRWLGPRNDES